MGWFQTEFHIYTIAFYFISIFRLAFVSEVYGLEPLFEVFETLCESRFIPKQMFGIKTSSLGI